PAPEEFPTNCLFLCRLLPAWQQNGSWDCRQSPSPCVRWAAPCRLCRRGEPSTSGWELRERKRLAGYSHLQSIGPARSILAHDRAYQASDSAQPTFSAGLPSSSPWNRRRLHPARRDLRQANWWKSWPKRFREQRNRPEAAVPFWSRRWSSIHVAPSWARNSRRLLYTI